ncbi:hypothetical protein MHU86_12914 [Fragilaria crotonensis]|nr:hypothetical protein MHU86_12914 [Fragilaria crotonensis]
MKLFRKQKTCAAASIRDPERKTSIPNTSNDLQFAKEWKDLPCPGILRRFCAMTMWGIDKMIVVGGRDQECRILDSVEVYDFSRWEWTFLPPLNRPREEGVAIVVETKLYVFGGFGRGCYLSDCEVLDLCQPEGGFVRLRNGLPKPLKGAVAVSNGHWIYIVGGYNATVGHLDTVFALDTHSLEWDSTFPSLCTARHLPAVTVFGDTLVVAGGRSLGRRGGVKDLRSVECFNLVDGARWSFMAPMVSSRSGAVAFVFNGNVYVIGGEVRKDHPASSVMRYNGTRWSQKPFRSMIRSCPGTLLVSPSRMTLVPMDHLWDFKCLACTSVKESDAFLKFEKLQRLEYELTSEPSIERVRELMHLYQLAMEWDEEHHGSHQHEMIATQIRNLLTQPHITKILNEEGDGSDSTIVTVAEKDEVFDCENGDNQEGDYSQPVLGVTEIARPDGPVPGVNSVASAMVPVRTGECMDAPVSACEDKENPSDVESTDLVSQSFSDKMPMEQHNPVANVHLINDSVDEKKGVTIPVNNFSNAAPLEERNQDCILKRDEQNVKGNDTHDSVDALYGSAVVGSRSVVDNDVQGMSQTGQFNFESVSDAKGPATSGDSSGESVDVFNGTIAPVVAGSAMLSEQSKLESVATTIAPIPTGDFSDDSVNAFDGTTSVTVVGGEDLASTTPSEVSHIEPLVEATEPIITGDSNDGITNAMVIGSRSVFGDDMPSTTSSEESNVKSVGSIIEPIPSGDSSGLAADDINGTETPVVVGSRSLVGDDVPSITPSEPSNLESVDFMIGPSPAGDSSAEAVNALDGTTTAIVVVGDDLVRTTPPELCNLEPLVDATEAIIAGDSTDGILTPVVVGSRSVFGNDVPFTTPSEQNNLESVGGIIEPIPAEDSSGKAVGDINGNETQVVVGSRSLVGDGMPSMTLSERINLESVATAIEPIPTGDSSDDSVNAFDGTTSVMVVGGEDLANTTPSEVSHIEPLVEATEPIITGDSNDGITNAMVIGSRSLFGDDMPSTTSSEESNVKSVGSIIEPIPSGDSSGLAVGDINGTETPVVVGSRSVAANDVPGKMLTDPVTDAIGPITGGDLRNESLVDANEPITPGDSSDGIAKAMVVGNRSAVGDNAPFATPSETSDLVSVVIAIEPIPTGNSTVQTVDDTNGILTPVVVGSKSVVGNDVPSATPSQQSNLESFATTIGPIPTGDAGGEAVDEVIGIITPVDVGRRSFVGDDLPSSEQRNLESSAKSIVKGERIDESNGVTDCITVQMDIRSSSLAGNGMPMVVPEGPHKVVPVPATKVTITNGAHIVESIDSSEGKAIPINKVSSISPLEHRKLGSAPSEGKAIPINKVSSISPVEHRKLGSAPSEGKAISINKVSSISPVEHRKLGSAPSSKKLGTTLPRVVSPDQGRGKVSKTIVSAANGPVVSPRVISPDQGSRTVSNSIGANKKAGEMLTPVVSPDQGRSKVSKTKHPVKTTPRVVSPDVGTHKAFKIADGNSVSIDSSPSGKQLRGKTFKATSRRAIPVRPTQATCDDESSVEELWA